MVEHFMEQECVLVDLQHHLWGFRSFVEGIIAPAKLVVASLQLLRLRHPEQLRLRLRLQDLH
jgi:hypothetical protein